MSRSAKDDGGETDVRAAVTVGNENIPWRRCQCPQPTMPLVADLLCWPCLLCCISGPGKKCLHAESLIICHNYIFYCVYLISPCYPATVHATIFMPVQDVIFRRIVRHAYIITNSIHEVKFLFLNALIQQKSWLKIFLNNTSPCATSAAQLSKEKERLSRPKWESSHAPCVFSVQKCFYSKWTVWSMWLPLSPVFPVVTAEVWDSIWAEERNHSDTPAMCAELKRLVLP